MTSEAEIAETLAGAAAVTEAHDAPSGAPTRSESRSLASNGVAMVLSRLVTPVFGWAGSVVVARTLSPEAWGQYSFVFGLLGLMAVVTDLGVGRVVIGRLADSTRESFGAVAGSFIALRIALGALGYAVALGYAWIVGLDPAVVAVVALAGSTVLLATPANALLILFQSRLKLVHTATWDIVAQVVQFGLILVVVRVHPTLLAFVLPPIAKELIVLGSRVVIMRLGGLDGRVPHYRRPFRLWGEMLREAIPISIGLALITVLTKIDTLMLERLDSMESVGLYAIGYKFSDVLVLAVSALAVPFTTALVRAWGSGDEAHFRARTRQAVTVAAGLCGLAVVGFVPAADEVIGLLYGPQFVEAATAARLVVLAAAFSSVTMIALAVLVSAQKLRVFPWIAAGGVALNVGLNVVLIPRWSMAGAAAATLVTEALLAVAFLVLTRRSTRVERLVPWGPLLRQACVVLGLVAPAAVLVAVDGLPWIPVAAVACTLHIVATVACGCLDGGIRIPVLDRLRPSRERRRTPSYDDPTAPTGAAHRTEEKEVDG